MPPQNRADAKKLPPKDTFVIPPLWSETREDRDAKINTLLDSALGIVTEVPVVEFQKRIETLRKNIREIDDQIVQLREKQLTAPKDGMLPGIITDTVDSLTKKIEDNKKRIDENKAEIKKTKGEVHAALEKIRRQAVARPARPDARQRAVGRSRAAGGGLQRRQGHRSRSSASWSAPTART